MADLEMLAMAAVAAVLPDAGPAEAWSADLLPPCVAALRRAPAEEDRRLVDLADALGLGDAELMAVALCLAADRDAEHARALAEAQAPLGGSRPLLGLAARALAPLGASVAGIAAGAAVGAGLLRLGEEAAALPERSLILPLPMLAALSGRAVAYDTVRPLEPRQIPLPASMLCEAEGRAGAMVGRARAGLVLRSADCADALAAASVVAGSLGLGLAHVAGEPPAGLAPWLMASRSLPVFMPGLGPGQRWALPRLDPYTGPWIVVTGIDGTIEADSSPDDWTLPVPATLERTELWLAAEVEPALARRAAEGFRQGAGRIAEVAARAKLNAARREARDPAWSDIILAISAGAGSLDALARRSGSAVDDEALVLPPALRDALDRLLDRARVRCTLAEGLGPAVGARYRPGVRALFVGESGTGKTLAAHWLATKLGLPLYRVDLAALTSKYIGETEKNLSAILGAAEHADVLLFFDEADALFGARTEVSDSHDRYANAQTNYLLQRIEDFDGIAVLASNSRERFDPAFTRRLDAILDFPMPEGPARRDLWTAHLGARHRLSEAELDRLAVTVDLAGGHIRSIVLAAAARATVAGRPIAWADLAPAVEEEYRKLGRPGPGLLR
ncbi:MAG: ATP-binding protein [Gemmatimonadetes bacterium]|nr:ATP-binding protein [Gemmatimonadota bacterium]